MLVRLLCLSSLLFIASACALGAPHSFPLDAPDGEAGLISHTAPASPDSNFAYFGGNLSGDLDATGFTFGSSNSFALATDIVVQTSDSIDSGVGTLDYTVETTISGLTFDLAGGEVRYGDTTWHALPTLTPTGGSLASTIDATFTPIIGGPVFTSGSASADVGTAGDSFPPSSASVEFDPSIFMPGGGYHFETFFDVQLTYSGLSITLPGSPFDLASIIAPAMGAHYDNALMFDGAIDSIAPPPEFLGLAGDHNGNDVVDAADYTLWRDALEANTIVLLNDGTPGSVDELDFVYWRDHFGETAPLGSGSAAAVPEPASVVLLALGWLMSLRWRRWCWRRGYVTSKHTERRRA